MVIEDHRAPVVVQMLWYRVGAADETPGKSGIAHFLEHLMFKGTETLEAGAFSRIVEANGGTDNAFTSFDYTAYFQRVAADRLPLMMEMEADRMRGLVLSDEDVDTEREVVLEERTSRTDSDPAALFREKLRAMLFRNHSYGVPVLGWRHEIEALSRADAMRFYDSHYAPDNVVLIVAGDVEPDAVLALAKKHYGPIAATGIVPRIRLQEPPNHSTQRLTFADPRVTQPSLMRTYRAPSRKPGDQSEAAALYVLAELLGGEGATSVLGRALQFETQIAVYTGAHYAPTALDDTTFSFIVVPAQGTSLAVAEAALDDALTGFLETGPDPAEFERLKMQIRAAEIYALDDVGDIADRYGRALTTGLTVTDVQTWPDALQAVTPQDVLAAAQALLNDRASITGWLMSEDTK